MLTEPQTENDRLPSESEPPPLSRDEETLRRLASEHVARVRKFKVDLAAYLVGIFVLACIWAITEYQNSGGWPEQISDQSNPGDWNPWIFWVILGWGFFVAIDAIKTYFHRPTTEAEIEREVERMKSRR